MEHLKYDEETIKTTQNTARFFTENRQIAWVLLFFVIFWGIYGYFTMPKRKDPDVPMRVALAVCPWPGAKAEKIEQLVTRKIEEKIAENARVEKIESTTRTSVTIITITLQEKGDYDVRKEFDDIQGKLDSITGLPDGAGPVIFKKDFGDTAALMLTVATPKVGEVELSLRTQAIRKEIEAARSRVKKGEQGSRFTLLFCFPQSTSSRTIRSSMNRFVGFAVRDKIMGDHRGIEGPGFVGVDASTDKTDDEIRAYGNRYIRERLHASEFHPDTWYVLVRDPKDTMKAMAAVSGNKYSYRELDDFTDLMQKTLQTVPQVSKIDRSGVLDEKIYLAYSQERLASYGIQPAKFKEVLNTRNITLSGGVLEIEGKSLPVIPSGEYTGEKEIGDTLMPIRMGNPVYLRDLVDIDRAYDSPPSFLNFYTWRDAKGEWQRSPAITMAIQMRPGEQIGDFGRAVDEALEGVKRYLPEDLILAKTSDQPQQVEENVDLFMDSLYEAIFLVVLVSLIGFWEWRSALLLAFSIPLTLAMTFGMMRMLGIDVQQVSIASLIIALGLLVDDPVVAGDAIKRDLALGHKPIVAAWLGPTKLKTAILFATITNIVAYLPFLTLSGDVGKFLYSLPIVLTCSLIASRIVSMTFTPLLGYHLLRPSKKQESSIEEKRARGFFGFYYKIGTFAINHRWKVLAGSFVFLLIGGLLMAHLKTQFFPRDLSYLSYIDVWLPEDTPLSASSESAKQVEAVVRRFAEQYGKEHGKKGKPREVLESLTTFVGGGGPRFWFSLSPEQNQPNYAQVIVQVKDKRDTNNIVDPLQKAITENIVGARVDVRQLDTGKPVGVPVSIRLSGQDLTVLRGLAEGVKDIYRSVPMAGRIRDDWGTEGFMVRLNIDADRANLSGATNLDVAVSSAAGLSGIPVGTLREGHKQIPIVARMRMDERSQLGSMQDLYVYPMMGQNSIPLRQTASIGYTMEAEKIKRRNQFRTITVSCFPEGDVLSSQVMKAVDPKLEKLRQDLPPGYKMEIGGEQEEQQKGFKDLAVVMLISVTAIFIALVIQFRNAIKPLLVFAAIPYGMVGAFAGLAIMGQPFGFMAFLGVASLVGVIVSHVIVLFDFIETMHEKGEPLKEALLDAGIVRLRPVLITVGATVFGLVPLAYHGGPLWEPLCYAQIGGLTAATAITLLLVPVLYAIFVLDLKIVKWEERTKDASNEEERSPA